MPVLKMRLFGRLQRRDDIVCVGRKHCGAFGILLLGFCVIFIHFDALAAGVIDVGGRFAVVRHIAGNRIGFGREDRDTGHLAVSTDLHRHVTATIQGKDEPCPAGPY